MNAVAWSLYGTGEVYLRGLMENLRRLPHCYPGWQAVIYSDGECGAEYVRLCEARGAKVHLRPPEPGTGGSFWRFEAVGDVAYDVVLVRDADSVIGTKEQRAVQAWLDSSAGFHMIHDSPHHRSSWPILGGLWGARTRALPMDFPRLVRWWLRHKGPFRYGDDEWFLNRYIWPYAMRDGLLHTDNPRTRFCGEPFPLHPPELHHAGERLTEDDLPPWTVDQ